LVFTANQEVFIRTSLYDIVQVSYIPLGQEKIISLVFFIDICGDFFIDICGDVFIDICGDFILSSISVVILFYHRYLW